MALAVLVVEAKATTTETRTAQVVLEVLVVPAEALTLALVALVERVVQAATAALTEMVVAAEPQAAPAQQVQMATTPTALPVRAALAARQAAQPGSTSVVYPTSHSRTMEPFKEERPDAVHNP